ncbi:MAG: glycosyltransferase family 4 protein [Gammaproteobacteria bacterium]|nr:glycosyltransferase family 4 protein [Gammaproteobacteria bacterium]
MVNWVLLAAAVVVSGILTLLLLRFYRGKNWLDRPVDRSAHDRPMPSSGGVAMVITFLVGVAYYLGDGVLSLGQGLIFLGCLPIAIVGLIDDLQTIDFRWRLVFQFGSAILVVSLVYPLPPIQLGPLSIEFSVLVHSLAVLAFVWLLNLFNFMDGIDGLAASETMYVTLLSSLLVINSQDQAVLSVALLLGSVALGFLAWNWPPAKIFMGDVGSNFLAYTLGALAIISIANGSMNPWSWLLLLGVFVVDATYTLCYRLLDGQRWYEAHNSHGYQYGARLANSHRTVTLAVLLLNLFWLAPLGWLAARNPGLGLYLTVLGYLPLIVLVRKLQAGTPVVEQAY